MQKNRNGGFTLIEVLVALVIFSIMATGFLRYISERAKQTGYLADKTLAAIVADNALAELQIAGQWPPTGKTSQQVSMADKQWQVMIDVQDTDHPALRRLDVTVSLPAASRADTTQTLISLTGFAGKN